MQGRTSFVIAHRLSTIRNANRILVIENGRIAKWAATANCCAERGHYYRLYTQQFRRELEREYDPFARLPTNRFRRLPPPSPLRTLCIRTADPAMGIGGVVCGPKA